MARQRSYSSSNQVAAYGLNPVDNRAAGGVRGSTIPVPISGRIDCRGWSHAKLWDYLERRVPKATPKMIAQLVEAAKLDGYIQ